MGSIMLWHPLRWIRAMLFHLLRVSWPPRFPRSSPRRLEEEGEVPCIATGPGPICLVSPACSRGITQGSEQSALSQKSTPVPPVTSTSANSPEPIQTLPLVMCRQGLVDKRGRGRQQFRHGSLGGDEAVDKEPASLAMNARSSFHSGNAQTSGAASHRPRGRAIDPRNCPPTPRIGVCEHPQRYFLFEHRRVLQIPSSAAWKSNSSGMELHGK